MDMTLAITFLVCGAGLTALSIYFFINLKKQEKEQNLKKKQNSSK